MDINKLTQRSQEAVQEAQTLAVGLGHQEVDGEHLLLALVTQEGGLVPNLLAKLDTPVDALRTALESELDKRPKISGGASEAGKIYVTQRFQQLGVAAAEAAKRLKDEYVSVEHLLLALIGGGRPADILPPRSCSELQRHSSDRFLETLDQPVRGSQRVTSATSGSRPTRALEKYGVDPGGPGEARASWIR